MEDHPSFNMGPGGRYVALHKQLDLPGSGGSNHTIEMNVPDGTALDISLANQVRKNFPNTSRNGGVQRVVWEEDDDVNARLMYAQCSSDCSQLTNWTHEQITDGAVHKDARRVEHIVDLGDQREFVSFSYDSSQVGAARNRVVLGTRCLGDATWTFEQVRDPGAGREFWDQMLNYGRPSIVLDKANDIVMLAFVEAEQWNDGNFPTPGTESNAVWIRADYGVLPSCL
jgi:hypothetical protein